MEIKERFKAFLEGENLSAKDFAERINVQASSISHIIKGRNKPSVDLLIKILEQYPEFDLHWLLTGLSKSELSQEVDKASSGSEIEQENKRTERKLNFIVCFYEDGHFERYEQG